MGRYANLLSKALADVQQASIQIEVMVRRLSLPVRKPGWLNAVWYAWFNHVWLILTARFRLRHSQADVLHIVDGSYAYVVPEGGPAAVATVHDLIPWLRLIGRFGSDRCRIRRGAGNPRRCRLHRDRSRQIWARRGDLPYLRQPWI